jgi:hypothetical protein
MDKPKGKLVALAVSDGLSAGKRKKTEQQCPSEKPL